MWRFWLYLWRSSGADVVALCWKIKLAVVLAIWQTSYDDVLQITPPPELADEHALFLEALRLYSEAANSIANGLETNDSELIDQAADQMDQASELLGQANDRFAALAQGEE